MKLLLACAMAAATLGNLPPQTAQAATISVNTLQDASDGSCSDGTCSLRDAILAAASGDEIHFDVTGTISLQSSLQIQKSLIIRGPGAERLSLKGNSKQVLSLYGANLTLTDLTITNGRASTGGGIYLGAQANLLLQNCVVSANTATTGGGGIYVDAGAALTVKDSTIQNNRASQRGGGLLVVSGATLDASASTFSGNAVTGFNGQGGGLYIDGGQVHLTDSQVTRNSADQVLAQGGGLFVNRGQVTLTDGLVRGNLARQAGGGLYAANGTTTLVNQTFSGNNSPSGSAVYNATGSGLAFTNSILWGNPSLILHQQISDPSSPTLSFTTSLVEGGIPGKSVLADDPTFIRNPGPGPDNSWGTADDDPGDLHLRPLSPAIDSGTNAACPARDLDKIARPVDGNGDGSPVCDLGAYEFVDRAPSAVALDRTTVDDGQHPGTIVGSFSATDPDPSDTFTYALVSGEGGEDNAAFTISGSRLTTAVTVHAAVKQTYHIRVRAFDKAHAGVDGVFTITVVHPLPALLPATGFAPGRRTVLPAQPHQAYASMGDLTLEIPALGIQETMVGVPQQPGGDWDVSWLSEQVGYLQGTAFPTWTGNSVLSAHSVLPSGLPGPFAHLDLLRYGDRVTVHAWGMQYIYEIRDVRQVQPDDLSPLQHRDRAWLTLLTCANYDAQQDEYRNRTAASAVLVQILPEA